MDKIIIKNIFSLFSIQTVNYLLPLLVVPYLVRVLGIDNFGIYSLILGIVQYLVILTDYGFNFSATRDVALNRDNKKHIGRVFLSVSICKICLLTLSICIILILAKSYSIYGGSHDLILALLCGISIIIGTAIFPVWLFQGCEKMVFIAISNFTARLIGTILVFFLVKSSGDIYIAVLLQGGTAILAGMLSLVFAFKMDFLCINRVEISDVIRQFKLGWHVFISTIFVSLYTNSIPIILGFTSGTESVGVFTAADKIRLALQGFIGPVSQALYPRLSRLMGESKNKAKQLIKKSFIYFILPLSIFSVTIFVFSEQIVKLFYGAENLRVSDVLKVLIIIPPIVGIGNLLGAQILLPLGKSKAFSMTYIVTGIFGGLLIYILSKQYAEYGVSVSLLGIEFLVSFIFYIQVRKLISSGVL
ncbi:hypothetical protein BWQ95_23165 [Aeromonas hydrophila]|uniref:flippase n=1 Tax=Aeromonas TaxID=642 RepID=UPI00097DE496|nr:MULTISPECIES: flippase [Aeromonas]MDX7672399.1 flippase [Aeromonas caviae]MDX7863122.1 flippase [Aeromonas caviae]ONG01646.1 hypothetical protein BWQ95_23165 [Aeromonas hydrophila]